MFEEQDLPADSTWRDVEPVCRLPDRAATGGFGKIQKRRIQQASPISHWAGMGAAATTRWRCRLAGVAAKTPGAIPVEPKAAVVDFPGPVNRLTGKRFQ